MATKAKHLIEDHLLKGSPDGDQIIGPNCLLVAFDETGHEELADPAYPIFGLGGCAIRVADYHAAIRNPWTKMKEAHFGGGLTALHASDLRKASQTQLNALGAFFRDHAFGRFAAVTSVATSLESDLTRYESTALVAAHCLGEVGGKLIFDSCAVIFEHSNRTDSLVRRVFSAPDLTGKQPTGRKWDVPTTFYFASKKIAEPIVEVADFIMHAAGTAVRARLQDGIPFLNRRDFAAVFEGGPARLASFVHLKTLAPQVSTDGSA